MSSKRLTRRQILKLAALGSLGGLAAACGSPATPTRAPTVPAPTATTRPAPSAVPTTAAAAPTSAPAATAAPSPTAVPLADEIAAAAGRFLSNLDEAGRAQATYAFADPERLRWHWTTPANFPRHGLPLRALTTAQRDYALALLQVSVSPAGFQKALDIMALQNDLGNDPELYYVTVFGEPGGAAPWGWRFEGHHLSRHLTVSGGSVAALPFFLGAWPTVSGAGLKAMEREEWAARELITALTGPAQTAALFQANTLTRHVTQNQAEVAPLESVGVLFGDLAPAQQALVDEIIRTYLATLPAALGEAQLAKLTAAGWENIRFGWAGPTEPRRPHYYRLQGPTFLLEHDNSRNGGTHIHSVWRDFTEDFGRHLG